MNQSNEKSDRGAALLPGEERRRSQRVIIRVPVTLELAKSDQKLIVPAHTVAVNTHGAMVACTRTFDEGTTLAVQNSRTNERTTARVTRTPRESAEGYLIPLEFTVASPTFWQISFPPTSWKQSDA